MHKTKFIEQKAKLLDGVTTMEKIFELTFKNFEGVYAQYTQKDEIKKITFGEYVDIIRVFVDKLSIELKEYPKDRYIGIKADNSPYWLAFFWATMMCGYKPVLIGFTEDTNKTYSILMQCKSNVIITDKKIDFSDMQESNDNNDINEVKVILMKDIISQYNIYNSNKDNNKKETELWEISANWSNEFAVCTSGTTGIPKVCVYDGRAIAAQIQICKLENGKINSRMIYDEEIRILSFLPLHHIFGILSALAYGYFGKTFVYLANRAPSTIIETCRKHEITLIYSVPLFYNNLVKGVIRKVSKNEKKYKRFKRLVNASIFIQTILPERTGSGLCKMIFKPAREALFGDSIDFMACGGGYVSKNTLKVLNAFGYYTACGFGMTEAGVTSFESGKNIRKRLSGSLGRPHFKVQYRTKPENGVEKETGELQMRGEVVYIAEIRNGEKVPSDLDSEGWYSTGDIARVNKKGMWIEGREKEVIINESGENVYPDELEALFENIEDAQQLCVLGIKNDDGYEDIALTVNLGEKLLDNNVLEVLSNAVHSINLDLPVFKKINRLFVTPEELPSANKIKVKRLELKNLLEKGNESFKELKIKATKQDEKENVNN